MSGTLMEAEMAQQPQVLAALRAAGSRSPSSCAPAPRPLHGTVLARGSSDHAGIFGRYLIEPATRRARPRWPRRACDALRRAAGLLGFLVVAVSQSGRTPEIVDRAVAAAAAPARAGWRSPTSPAARSPGRGRHARARRGRGARGARHEDLHRARAGVRAGRRRARARRRSRRATGAASPSRGRGPPTTPRPPSASPRPSARPRGCSRSPAACSSRAALEAALKLKETDAAPPPRASARPTCATARSSIV